MDVTSLLNLNSGAVEQLKQADIGNSRTPSRNRTPWDAGGYLLPINTATNGTNSFSKQHRSEKSHHDAPISTPPPSPKHRSTDSRSSFSSVISSSLSGTTHSRFSSTSTLNSSSHDRRKNSGTDSFFPEIRSVSQTLEACSLPLVIDPCQGNEDYPLVSHSPGGSPLEQLASIAESHLSELTLQKNARSDDTKETAMLDLIKEDTSEEHSNDPPGSPSDAILIKRTSIPNLRVNTEDLTGCQQKLYLSAPSHSYHPAHLQHKAHKRTLSEPNSRISATTKLSSVLYTRSRANFNPYLDDHSGAGQKQQVPTTSKLNINGPSSYAGQYSHLPRNSPKLNSNFAKTSLSRITPNISSLVPVNPLAAHGLSMEYQHQPIYLQNVNDRRMEAPSRLSIPSSLGTTAESTPPSSQHPDHESPTSSSSHGSSNSLPMTAYDDVMNRPITCEFVEICDTGSQMRKAISHIFGRNKMCTRQIPPMVWVHFCRKHYQRSRYRNIKDYAKTQCNLVQKQIRLINQWYEACRRSPGDGPLLWSLAVRKREQKRIQDLERKESGKRKRSGASLDDDDGEEDEGDGLALGHEPVTAVPKWLIARCRSGYTTAEVLDIFNLLQADIWDSAHTNTFPDLEILPELEAVAKDPKSPKSYSKRGRASSTHQRSQSLGVPVSRAAAWNSEEPQMQTPPTSSHDTPPSQKRRRSNAGGQYEDSGWESYPQISPQATRPLQGMGRMQNLVHRPLMYTHREESPEPHGVQSRIGCPPSQQPITQPLLLAPTPLRNNAYPLASQLERGEAFHRSTHHRSQSDFAFQGSLYSRQHHEFRTQTSSRPSAEYSPQRIEHHTGYEHNIPSGQPVRPEANHSHYLPPPISTLCTNRSLQTERSFAQHTARPLTNPFPYQNVSHFRHQSTPVAHYALDRPNEDNKATSVYRNRR